MSKQKLDRSDLLAIIAVLVSFISLGLGVYEANIMKQETEIMLQQQKTSVWPYINNNLFLSYGENSSVLFSITNKGVGPALVNKILLKKEEEFISTNYTEVYSLFEPIFAGVNQKEDSDFPINVSTGFRDNIIISPGETVELLKIECDRFPNDTKVLSDLVRSLSIKICYSSIYGDTWFLENSVIGPKPVESCNEEE